MSEADEQPRDLEFDIVDVDVRAWVEASRADPTRYRDRQVTEIVLTAIGLAPSLHANWHSRASGSRAMLISLRWWNLPI